MCFLHITPEHCFLWVYNYIFLNVLKVTVGFIMSQSLELHVCNLKITPAHFFVCIYNYIFPNVLEVTKKIKLRYLMTPGGIIYENRKLNAQANILSSLHPRGYLA